MARRKNSNDYALQTIISKDAAEFLSALAKEDDRSLVKYTKRIIMKHLEEKGYVEPLTKKERNEIKEEDSSHKKSSTVVSVEELKQSANCNSSSTITLNKNKKGSTKVVPVPMSFISQ